jgi:NADPH:quinone reductase-like Zn-dependent oxidoreductase
VVTALGPGTAGIAVGDEVFGLADPYRDAAAAEYVAVEARNLAPSRGPWTTSTPRQCRGLA